MEKEQVIEALRKAGLRATPQRIAICELLTESDAHPTANDIYIELKQQFPSLSLATIYNTLDVLVGIGLVNALGSIGDDKVHFDADVSPHINLACVKCHKIVDATSNFINQLNDEINKKSGFELFGSRILYYGHCPECQNKISQNSVIQPI
ncbi:MAG: transcriptional repressor [Anaerolineae bacterium]|jgi:Fur family peroxide stress response transcriptional regulator|nr:transcriptional repressor [Anaerolineae bacterium]PKO01891.1 MAG: transcriptional repressor [Chloroflexi bacterium HGW-Chloroflexi-5]